MIPVIFYLLIHKASTTVTDGLLELDVQQLQKQLTTAVIYNLFILIDNIIN